MISTPTNFNRDQYSEGHPPIITDSTGNFRIAEMGVFYPSAEAFLVPRYFEWVNTWRVGEIVTYARNTGITPVPLLTSVREVEEFGDADIFTALRRQIQSRGLDGDMARMLFERALQKEAFRASLDLYDHVDVSARTYVEGLSNGLHVPSRGTQVLTFSDDLLFCIMGSVDVPQGSSFAYATPYGEVSIFTTDMLRWQHSVDGEGVYGGKNFTTELRRGLAHEVTHTDQGRNLIRRALERVLL